MILLIKNTNFTKNFKMGCNDKQIKHTCGVITYASCTRYESGVSNNSGLTEGCITIEETTQDMYNQLDTIDTKIDMSALSNDCITFSEPRTPVSVTEQILNKLCSLEDIVTSQGALITTLQGQVAALQANVCP